jgi:hypothetical protein
MTPCYAHDTCGEEHILRPPRSKAWPSHSHQLRVRHKQRRETADALGLRATFNELAKIWRDETWHSSSLRRRVSHPAYLKIIGIGTPAIPWILEELRKEPDYWFAALEAITREDPAPYTDGASRLRDAWLAWGERRGY